jgi:hypothetical protein
VGDRDGAGQPRRASGQLQLEVIVEQCRQALLDLLGFGLPGEPKELSFGV